MDDDSPAVHPANPTCFDVYHHTATWIIAVAQGTSIRQRDTDAGGLVLYTPEMEAVRLPIRDVMDLLSGLRNPATGPPSDLEFWRSAIHWFSVCDGQGQIQHCRPGQSMPNRMKIHLV